MTHDDDLTLDELDAKMSEEQTGRSRGLEEYATYAMSQGWDPLPVFGITPEGGLNFDKMVENHLTILFDGLSAPPSAKQWSAS